MIYPNHMAFGHWSHLTHCQAIDTAGKKIKDAKAFLEKAEDLPMPELGGISRINLVCKGHWSFIFICRYRYDISNIIYITCMHRPDRSQLSCHLPHQGRTISRKLFEATSNPQSICCRWAESVCKRPSMLTRLRVQWGGMIWFCHVGINQPFGQSYWAQTQPFNLLKLCMIDLGAHDLFSGIPKNFPWYDMG